MCTLTYIPVSRGFILTSNRDEQIARKAALPPGSYLHNGVEVVYPKDAQAGGTWIAAADNGYTLCLLNGAFQRHMPAPPYRRSRGLVLLDFFRYNNPERFTREYDFEGIEPFTLVMIRKGEKQNAVDELRWDGSSTHSRAVDASMPQIWSSATLYDPEVIHAREQWFSNWLEQFPRPDAFRLLAFHHFGGSGDEKNDILMNRENKLRTLSITSISYTEAGCMIMYDDLLAGKLYNQDMKWQPAIYDK
jgi:hypothetical protein